VRAISRESARARTISVRPRVITPTRVRFPCPRTREHPARVRIRPRTRFLARFPCDRLPPARNSAARHAIFRAIPCAARDSVQTRAISTRVPRTRAHQLARSRFPRDPARSGSCEARGSNFRGSYHLSRQFGDGVSYREGKSATARPGGGHVACVRVCARTWVRRCGRARKLHARAQVRAGAHENRAVAGWIA